MSIQKRFLRDGEQITVQLYARNGAIGVTDMKNGELEFIELRRVRTNRIADKSAFRWYTDYELPESHRRRTVSVRLHGDKCDKARRFNRTENVRPIAPSDPDFQRLFRIRNDAESINRGIEDSLYIGRAHSVGHQRQLLNLLGYALIVNGIASCTIAGDSSSRQPTSPPKADRRSPHTAGVEARPRSGIPATPLLHRPLRARDLASGLAGPARLRGFSARFSTVPAPSPVALRIEHRFPKPVRRRSNRSSVAVGFSSSASRARYGFR